MILRTLAANGKTLGRYGVRVPPGGKARRAIRQALRDRGGDLLPGTLPPRLQEILGDVPPARLVLSYEGFLGTYAKVLSPDGIYADAGSRAASVRAIFAGHDVEFFLAVRNPASFLPALFEASSQTDFAAFVAGCDFGRIAWSDPVAQIRDACPEVPLTVWCNEDLPLLWPEILRRLSGVDADLAGREAVLAEILTPEGLARLERRLADDPPADDAEWRALVAELLATSADPDALAPEIALPGWTEEVIADLTARYEADVARLAAMDGITFLAP